MSYRTVGVLASTLWVGCVYGAPAGPKLSGSIVGMVSDPAGVPQMGATVLLYNRFDHLLKKSLTSDKGTFGFDALAPEVYTIRVSLASFLPALKRNIVVQPGMQSLLNVSLASVFSSIELVATVPGNSALMSDEWKWVLRSSSSTRPVLRLIPELAQVRKPRRTSASSVFSETRGVVKVSAGDQADGSALGNEPDLGTAFALATSFLGKNRLQVSGNIGYSSASGVPSTGFRTSFSREMGGGMTPEIHVTMRQMFLPARAGLGLFGGMQDGVPAMRTLSASMLDHARVTDHVRFDYGFSMDSVTFLDRLNYFSPFGRLTWDRGNGEAFLFSYASGTPPVELLASDGEQDMQLHQDLTALAAFPRVSLRADKVRVQRAQSWEAAYHKKLGSRTYSVGVYDEGVSNAAVSMTGGEGLDGLDLLPDVFSSSWIFNAGRYHSLGYMASVMQSIGERFELGLAYGSGGALTAGPGIAEAATTDDLRAGLRQERRHSVTARVTGTVPQTGTQFATSYQWASINALTPGHLYLTQAMRDGLGFNVRIRQPLPYFGGLPGHLEATADLRNLLAQGYLPVNTYGRRTYLMHTPRTVRGGLSFIF